MTYAYDGALDHSSEAIAERSKAHQAKQQDKVHVALLLVLLEFVRDAGSGVVHRGGVLGGGDVITARGTGCGPLSCTGVVRRALLLAVY